MIALTHVLTAAASTNCLRRQKSKWLNNLATIASAALVSHWVLDFFPHVEPSNLPGATLDVSTPAGWFFLLDLLASACLSVYLFRKFRKEALPLAVGIISACVPDGIYILTVRILKLQPAGSEGLLGWFHWLHTTSSHGWWRPWFTHTPDLRSALLGIAVTVIIGVLPAAIYLRRLAKQKLATPSPEVAAAYALEP